MPERAFYDHPALVRLTLTERRVLLCWLRGLDDKAPLKEIGARLGMDLKTVWTHKRNLMGKLSIKADFRLVLYAIRCGLLLESEPTASIYTKLPEDDINCVDE